MSPPHPRVIPHGSFPSAHQEVYTSGEISRAIQIFAGYIFEC